MTPRRLIDTNIILRHLTRDHQRHAETATELILACDRGEIVLVILPAVLAECTFVLESFYKLERSDIAHALGALISSPGIEIDDLPEHLDALARYRRTKLHFVDCVIASMAVAEGVPVATFDGGFKKFSDVVVDLS